MKISGSEVMFVVACILIALGLYFLYFVYLMYTGFRRLDNERDAKISEEKHVQGVTEDKPTQTCEDVLEEKCTKPEYDTGIRGCRICAANNQSAIREARCTTSDQINDWCNKNFSCDQYQCTNPNDIKLLGKTCDEACTEDDCCADPNDPENDENLRNYCFTGDPNTNQNLKDICIKNVPDSYCKNKNVTWNDCKDNQAGAYIFCSNRGEATVEECKGAGQLDAYCLKEKATVQECKDNSEAWSTYCRSNDKATGSECKGNEDALIDFCLNNKNATFEDCKDNPNVLKFYCLYNDNVASASKTKCN
tara:strand:- start:1317 stop:2234 length:918 start_codon:yes stop_codon:yes gene_type:complete